MSGFWTLIFDSQLDRILNFQCMSLGIGIEDLTPKGLILDSQTDRIRVPCAVGNRDRESRSGLQYIVLVVIILSYLLHHHHHLMSYIRATKLEMCYYTLCGAIAGCRFYADTLLRELSCR